MESQIRGERIQVGGNRPFGSVARGHVRVEEAGRATSVIQLHAKVSVQSESIGQPLGRPPGRATATVALIEPVKQGWTGS